MSETTYKEFWMIYVSGRSGPAKSHDTYDSAYKEAVRLCSQPNIVGIPVYILRTTGAVVREVAPMKFVKLD